MTILKKMGMHSLKFTASGRLGVWDAINGRDMESWRTQLDELLKDNAQGIIESESHKLTETEDPALAAITAICDKIISRGNPTLVNLHWERILLSGPASEFMKFSNLDDGVQFDFEKSFLPPRSSSHLLRASRALLDLSRNGKCPTQRQKVDEVTFCQSAGAATLNDLCVYRAAWHLLLRPLAVQRGLRGVLLLYRYGVLDATKPQRILVVEEDMPALSDAFQMLWELWDLTNTLQPQIGVGPPETQIDVIGDRGLHDTGHRIKHIDRPIGHYDVVISHSLLLGKGHSGPLLDQVAPEYVASALRMRHEAGTRSKSHLLWSKEFHYRLENGNKIQEQALRRLLQIVFRKKDFRDGQLRSIVRLLRGKPAIVLLPTGGGKSLIYQFVGMLMPGMTVIVDPIISLMEDQVRSLKTMGIDRMTEISSQTKNSHEELRRMAEGELSYIFITPERMQSQRFRDDLLEAKSRIPISLVVLDEAHCLSEWGHDFRPAYLRLPHNLRAYCADRVSGFLPTLVALTGTASFAVLEDMQAELDIAEEDAIIRPDSFDRKELNFDVRKVSPRRRTSEMAQVRETLPERWQLNSDEFREWRQREKTDCRLVFCPHVNGELGVFEVAEELGHKHFYAGESPRDFQGDWTKHKQEKQRQFTASKIQELVTTKSFGMGIDKENICSTIHFVMPSSIEQFYQEAGRAGRNQIESYALCTVIYSHSEWGKAQAILRDSDHAEAMSKLRSVPRSRQGDAFVQLYFLLNSYKGREKEIGDTFKLWENWMSGASRSHQRNISIPFGTDLKKSEREKYIYRLAILGIVEDYTVDWKTRQFEVRIGDSNEQTVCMKLAEYLSRYKFKAEVDEKLKWIVAKEMGKIVLQAVEVLVNFIYDEVVAKRKEAIRNMAELCWNFEDSDSFRREILDYLEESPFTKELNSWRGRSFEEVGLATVRRVLEDLAKTKAGDEKGRLRALIGTTRRMLEADPNNVALRYLSVISRSVSPWESDRSVLDESAAMLDALRRESSSATMDVGQIQIELLHDIFQRRPNLAGGVANTMVTGEDVLQIARRLLGAGRKYGDSVRAAALGAVSSNVVEKISEISSFYDLDQLRRQDDSSGE